MYGCWGNRDGLETPRDFAFKKRSDLSVWELAQVQRRRRVVESASDALCCVKTYMRDVRLQHPPLLVLPQARCARVQGRPNTVEPITMSDVRAAQLEAIANVIEDDRYDYHRVARECGESCAQWSIAAIACARLARKATSGAGTSGECWQCILWPLVSYLWVRACCM